jgi:hypothetical protein
MCRGKRLVADFVAETGPQPDVPAELQRHLTLTVDRQWVVWAYKLAQVAGDQFVPLTGRPGYPADATAECRNLLGRSSRGTHHAPDPSCTCGFHALSDPRLPRLPARPDFSTLTVALSGRVLAFEWDGPGLLWRAERQTVVRIDRPARFDRTEQLPDTPRYPDDPDGRPAIVAGATPRDSGPARLRLPASSPVLPVSHDDAGWCLVSSPVAAEHPSAERTRDPLVLA